MRNAKGHLSESRERLWDNVRGAVLGGTKLRRELQFEHRCLCAPEKAFVYA